MDILACVGTNWEIGKDDKLIYHIKKDMDFFKEMTLRNAVVMGRKTLESLPNGKPLKDRLNIVLSSKANELNKHLESDNLIYIDNIKDIYRVAKNLLIFCIGGESVYRELLPYCQNAYITYVFDRQLGDTFFPNLEFNDDWKVKYSSVVEFEEDIPFSFRIYENQNVKNLS